MDTKALSAVEKYMLLSSVYIFLVCIKKHFIIK